MLCVFPRRLKMLHTYTTGVSIVSTPVLHFHFHKNTFSANGGRITTPNASGKQHQLLISVENYAS